MRGDYSRWNYETRLLAGTLLAQRRALLALLAALYFAADDISRALTIWSVVALITLGLAFAVRRRAVYPLNTLANLLEALREGDYSLRGSRARRGDAIGEVVIESQHAVADAARTAPLVRGKERAAGQGHRGARHRGHRLRRAGCD